MKDSTLGDDEIKRLLQETRDELKLIRNMLFIQTVQQFPYFDSEHKQELLAKMLDQLGQKMNPSFQDEINLAQ